MKFIFATIFALFIYLFIPFTTYASGDYTTSYDVTYTVNEDATTHAEFDISLTNNTTSYYASSYKLQLGFPDIENLKAQDEGGPIIPVLTPLPNGQAIELTFNKPVAGVNKTNHFSISFDTKSIAEHQGNIWEVNIPGLSAQNTFSDFTVHLQTPNDFGPLLYAKPKSLANSFTFTKSQLGTAGISLAFGKQQIYHFSLLYHLKNSGLFTSTQTIALPPDTNYQQVAITNMSPKPQNVQKDADGNWIATYYVSPLKIITVHVTGDAKMSLNPSLESITQQQISDYTEPQQYWETQDSQIQMVAKSLNTPQDIYNYVVHTLHYDFSRVTNSKPRLGAAAVIRQPNSAVCLEFTDLFIALARAKGIPARELDGFAYTNNERERPLSLVKDILHAWPEYYDFQKKTWIMVDPTWGNTTGGVDYFHQLDFDHLVFAIKGESSTMPIPAGGYNFSSGNNKDVDVSFVSNMPSQKPSAIVDASLPKPIPSFLPLSGKVIVSNTGVYALATQSLKLSTTSFLPRSSLLTVPSVLPYGHQSVSFVMLPTKFLTNSHDTLTIQQPETTKTVALSIVAYTTQSLLILGGVFIAAVCIIISIFAASTGRLPFFRR